MATDVNAAKRLAQWRDSLDRACGFDSWGQVLEAAEEYEKLNKSILKVLTSGDQNFNDNQQRFLNKLAIVSGLRAKSAQDLSGEFDADLGVEQMRLLLPALKELGSSSTVPAFPFETASLKRQLNQSTFSPSAAAKGLKKAVVVPDGGSDDEDAGPGAAGGGVRSQGGSLLPRKTFPKGGTSVCVRIEKIKLKDPSQYLEPFISISVKDIDGNDLCAVQDTPVAAGKDEMFVTFNQDVHLQVPMENIGKGCAVVFEFKHYKPKKHKTSTKCWCFMEPDEFRNGATVALELYNKPADYKRKKLYLLTEKAHYLYVGLSLLED